MAAIVALYAGTCNKCGTGINTGEQIVKHHGKWCHQGCTQGGLEKHEYDSSEYAKGRARAEYIRETARLFGEEAAFAEELAWELKDPDPAY